MKQQKVPENPTNFLAKMDGRVALVKALKAEYDELCADLGGADSLSLVRRTLAERFIWLSAILRHIEQKIPTASPAEAGELLGKWTQAVNTAIGLAKTLGIERRARKADLRSYIEGAGK